jgi:hypothetical protein
LLPFLPENREYVYEKYCLADTFFSSWSTSIKLFFRKWVIKHTFLPVSRFILYPYLSTLELICLEKEGWLCYSPRPSTG